MTLRKSTIADNAPQMNDFTLESNLKISSFKENLIKIGNYLSSREKFPGNHHFRTDWKTLTCGVPIIIVGNRKSDNSYITAFRDVFENEYYLKTYYTSSAPYKHSIEKNQWWTCFDINDYNDLTKLNNILRLRDNIIPKNYHIGYDDEGDVYDMISTSFLKLYIIFWNLFLCALDDDIYNEQLPLVIELAHCFNLDEHILRDLCRGVEYVLSGKKLSPDCDLQCDTVECAKFFLGKEE